MVHLNLLRNIWKADKEVLPGAPVLYIITFNEYNDVSLKHLLFQMSKLKNMNLLTLTSF